MVLVRARWEEHTDIFVNNRIAICWAKQADVWVADRCFEKQKYIC